MNRTVTVYVCDRCHEEAEVRADTRAAEQPAPKGWQRVSTEPMNGDPEALAPCWELCPSCFREHLLRILAPVDRVKDLQAAVPA